MFKKTLLALALVAGSSLSYADAEVETAYRQGVMKAVGGHMTAIGTILRNQVHFDDLALHARGIATLADIAPGVFAEGTQSDKSKTLDAAWENPAEFKAAMDKFVMASKEFAAATESGDMSKIGPGVQALGGSCKGCHDDFKAE